MKAIFYKFACRLPTVEGLVMIKIFVTEANACYYLVKAGRMNLVRIDGFEQLLGDWKIKWQ